MVDATSASVALGLNYLPIAFHLSTSLLEHVVELRFDIQCVGVAPALLLRFCLRFLAAALDLGEALHPASFKTDDDEQAWQGALCSRHFGEHAETRAVAPSPGPQKYVR